MVQQAHKGLNDFMNQTLAWNRQELQRGVPRYPLDYAHTVEWDEYYELKPEGRNALQHLAHWINPNHTVKVRRTFDQKTQEMKAQIVKTRIADLEIYNPNDRFDYRISISLESPWQGPEEHLVMSAQVGSDRFKDRLSYKHRDYQIDLTQISHPGGGKQDHEVEIEINNDSFTDALEAARSGDAPIYEKCIGGFVDNIRILALQASASMAQTPIQGTR